MYQAEENDHVNIDSSFILYASLLEYWYCKNALE